jgi:threonine dehydrogenase-like Zn-dependent dehydrogenase
VAELEERAEPQIEPGHALLRVRRVGLCGTDLNSFRGRNPMVSYPRVPGHEVAATIAALPSPHPEFREGMDVSLSPYTACGVCASCRKGRRNACRSNQTLGVQRDGALTQFISMPVESLYKANLSLEELCLVEPLTVGAHAVARGEVTAGDTVAVFGCGGVGLGAIAASAARGATTIAIDLEQEKLALARRAGAAYTVQSGREDLAATLADLTGGLGPGVVIEAIGIPATFRAAVDLVAFSGRVVYIGYAKEPVTYETRLFVQKELDIRGSRNALPADFRSVIAMLEQHRFPVDAVIGNRVPLEGAPGILFAWSASPGQFAKIMVDLDQV